MPSSRRDCSGCVLRVRFASESAAIGGNVGPHAWHRNCGETEQESVMKLNLIGSLALALAAACGNGTTSNEPVATPAAATAGAVQGALPVGKTTTTGQTSAQTQNVSGQPLPNAGVTQEAAGPGHSPRPSTTFLIPQPPHPVDTGDPCGWCQQPASGHK
jgi:hypothetical protein